MVAGSLVVHVMMAEVVVIDETVMAESVGGVVSRGGETVTVAFEVAVPPVPVQESP